MTTVAIPPLIDFGALAQRLALIVGGLRLVVAALAGRNRAVAPMMVLTWTRVGRLQARFEVLVARLQAGRPAPPRRLRKGARATRPALIGNNPPPGALRLPEGFGWLVRLLKWEAVAYGSQLQALLAEPAMAALLKADPRAGRIFRPLCRMLAIKPEGSLALAKIRRKPAPKRTGPETAGPPTAGTRKPGPEAPCLRSRTARPAAADKPKREPPSAISQVWAALLRQTVGGITPVPTPDLRARKPPW